MAKSNKPEAFDKLKAPSVATAVFNCVFIIMFSISLIYVESIFFRVFALVNVILNAMLFTFNTMKLYSIKKACEDFKKFIMEVLGGKEKY